MVDTAGDTVDVDEEDVALLSDAAGVMLCGVEVGTTGRVTLLYHVPVSLQTCEVCLTVSVFGTVIGPSPLVLRQVCVSVCEGM